jgi:hypothetical protein
MLESKVRKSFKFEERPLTPFSYQCLRFHNALDICSRNFDCDSCLAFNSLCQTAKAEQLVQCQKELSARTGKIHVDEIES